MAELIITGGDVGASAGYTAGGVTEIIASGDFTNATVGITVSANGGFPAQAYTFFNQGAVSLQSAAGTLITATVTGAGPASIDVSCSP